MSQNWSHGYFTEIDYTRGIYREMTPTAIRQALLLRGQVIPDADKFRFAELGCGHGLTSLAIAAVHPQAEVVAIDINPAQIAGARALAEAAGLTNIRFEEWSFSDFLNADIDQFDYTAAHGILSWVGREQHKEIAEVFSRKLKPGGIAYVSYNALPGWAPMLPIRRVMQEHAKRSSRPAVDRVKDATRFVTQLQNANAAVFTAMPTLKDRLQQMEALAPAYLAHEYLNEHWIPFAFPEIVEMFEPAKLSFAGSASMVDYFDITSVVPAAREVMKDIEDPVFYETIRDIYINQGFRKDLFVKGAQKMEVIRQNEEFGALRFAAQKPFESRPKKFSSPVGDINLKAEIYEPLAAHVAEGPVSVTELQAKKDLKTVPLAQLGQALAIMVGQGYAAPCLSEASAAAAADTTGRVNNVLLEKSRSTPDIGFLMSPVIGTGVKVGAVDMLLIRHGKDAETRAARASADLAASGRSISKDGRPITDRAELDVHIGELAVEFDTLRRPVLSKLGVLPS